MKRRKKKQSKHVKSNILCIILKRIRMEKLLSVKIKLKSLKVICIKTEKTTITENETITQRNEMKWKIKEPTKDRMRKENWNVHRKTKCIVCRWWKSGIKIWMKIYYSLFFCSLRYEVKHNHYYIYLMYRVYCYAHRIERENMVDDVVNENIYLKKKQK